MVLAKLGAVAIAAVGEVAVETSAVAHWSWSLASTYYQRQLVRMRSLCCLASWSGRTGWGGSWERRRSNVAEEEGAACFRARPWVRCASSIDEIGDDGSLWLVESGVVGQCSVAYESVPGLGCPSLREAQLGHQFPSQGGCAQVESSCIEASGIRRQQCGEPPGGCEGSTHGLEWSPQAA